MKSYRYMQTKTKTKWLIAFLITGITVVLLLIVLFLMQPNTFLLLISLPAIFAIFRCIYLLRANTRNHMTRRKFKATVLF